MAGTIKYDMEGSSYSAGVDGNVWNRRFLIEGLLAGPSIPDLIEEAYQLIPNTGTPAPAPIGNMFVRDATLERIWCEEQTGIVWSANGVIVYTTPNRTVGGLVGVPDDNGPGITIAGSSSVVEKESKFDASGSEVFTVYDNAVMAHNVTSFEIARSFTFARLENTRPDARKDQVEGRLNNATWNGYAAETVLLSGIDWSSDDGGATYAVEYTFAIRPDWTVKVVHEDPFFPGQPLTSQAPGDKSFAERDVDVLLTADFSVLNITL